MKHITATLAAASLLAVMPVASTPAFAGPNSGNTQIVDFCASHGYLFPQETLGNCVALYSTGGVGAPGFLAQLCGFFMKSRPDDFYAVYDSYHECILDAASSLP